MTDKNLYNKDSIESLDPLSFTRLKPGVYCGDTNYSVVKVLAYNTTITILEEQNGWGKIGNEQYVSLRYTAKI